MKTLLLIGVVVLAGILLLIRLAPSDPNRWHVDPFTADHPGAGGNLIRTAEGAMPVLVYDETPEALLTRLDAIAMADPHTTRLAGRPDEGRITYITRTRLGGFPDYTTVAARDAEAGAEIAILGRLRFGYSDLDVNQARMTRWLNALR